MTIKGTSPRFMQNRGSCYRNGMGFLEGPTYRQCTICRVLYKRWSRRIDYCKKCNKEYYTPKFKESQLIRGSRQIAKKIGMVHNITLEDIVIPEICPILKVPLNTRSGTMADDSASLDRIDNSKGYTKENIWVISSLANTMKNRATPEQLIAFGKWTKEYFKW